MDRKEAKAIVSTAVQVFAVLAEERGIDVESPEGDALFDQIVIGTMARKAKSAADFGLMMEVA
ncbi:hypothetical protein [Paraburkholderia hospita]|uniref:hypothetical protein n=1 Tax=Paraburkholderia hospita TaxID=169430 RepID=UPI000B341D3C|nr:hypothetical protein [Paraburkholderia hospita]OUL79909.1 hypothetical protein CA603_33055 [Paraburkholderia hospita]